MAWAFFGFRAWWIRLRQGISTLRQPFGVGKFSLLSVKYFINSAPMILRFSGSVTPASFAKTALRHQHESRVRLGCGKHVHHHLPSVQTQQTVVNKHAGQLVAGRGESAAGRVHAAET